MAYSTYSGVQRKTANRRAQDTYVVGNTVRKLNVVEELQNPVQQKPVAPVIPQPEQPEYVN